MMFPNFVAGAIVALSVGVSAGPCRPSSQTTVATTTAETSAAETTAETSLATSTILTTSGLDVTTDLTTFITLSETTTSELASTSAFVPADLFPCEMNADCAVYVQLCDNVRCGCINEMCEPITDSTTATVEATTTTEATTAEVIPTTEATTAEVIPTTETTDPAAETSSTEIALPAAGCGFDSECPNQPANDGLTCGRDNCICEDGYCILGG
ncbi:hypothetical protein ACHAPU_002352 [Fusarium lateritium]